MTITLHCEDDDGWSWTEDADIDGTTEDELIDAAIEAAQCCFAPGWDNDGKPVSGPSVVTCDVGEHWIEVRNEDDVTVF